MKCLLVEMGDITFKDNHNYKLRIVLKNGYGKRSCFLVEENHPDFQKLACVVPGDEIGVRYSSKSARYAFTLHIDQDDTGSIHNFIRGVTRFSRLGTKRTSKKKQS